MTAARPIRGLNAPLRSLEQVCRDMKLDVRDYRPAPRIITTHVYPPIPDRRWDYSAHYDGEEDEQMDMGWGATEAEAVEDLRENFPRGDEE